MPRKLRAVATSVVSEGSAGSVAGSADGAAVVGAAARSGVGNGRGTAPDEAQAALSTLNEIAAPPSHAERSLERAIVSTRTISDAQPVGHSAAKRRFTMRLSAPFA